MTDELASRLEDLMVRYGIAELDIDEGNLRLSLRHRAPHPPAPSDAVGTDADTASIFRSTSFGTLHLSHPASAVAPPILPRTVRRGEIIAYVSIGPLLRPILAERDAVLVAQLRADGAEIGYGDPLFKVVEAASRSSHKAPRLRSKTLTTRLLTGPSPPERFHQPFSCLDAFP